MSEDIKEILDKFDKVLENYELDKKWGQMSVDSICHLFPSEIITIKDYITNLQQYYNDNVNKYEELLVKYSDLQEEKERLNNIINELEKYINEEYIYDELGMKIFDASKLQEKLQELKGSEKE